MSCDHNKQIKSLQDAELLLNNACVDFNMYAADTCGTFKKILRSFHSNRKSTNWDSLNHMQDMKFACSPRSSSDYDMKLKHIQERLKKSVHSSSLRTRKNLLHLNNLCNQQQLQLLPCISLKSQLYAVACKESRNFSGMYFEENAAANNPCASKASSSSDALSYEYECDRTAAPPAKQTFQHDLKQRKARDISNLTLDQFRYAYEDSAALELYDEFKRLPEQHLHTL